MAALLKKHSIVQMFKKAGVSEKSSAKRKRSLSFGIISYLFGCHEVNMSYLT